LGQRRVATHAGMGGTAGSLRRRSRAHPGFPPLRLPQSRSSPIALTLEILDLIEKVVQEPFMSSLRWPGGTTRFPPAGLLLEQHTSWPWRSRSEPPAYLGPPPTTTTSSLPWLGQIPILRFDATDRINGASHGPECCDPDQALVTADAGHYILFVIVRHLREAPGRRAEGGSMATISA